MYSLGLTIRVPRPHMSVPGARFSHVDATVIWSAVGALGTVVATGVAAWAAYQSRSSAQQANLAATTLATIERDRRHAELTPRFELTFSWLPGDPRTDLQVVLRLIGPADVDHVDSLSLTSRAVTQDLSGRTYPNYIFKALPYPSLRSSDVTKEEAEQGWTLSQPLVKLHSIAMFLTPRHLPENTGLPLGEYVAMFDFELRTRLGNEQWAIYGEFDARELHGPPDNQRIVIP
jgi:hypothetical protein